MILEGRADLISEKASRTRVQKLYRTKYANGFPDDSDLFAVRPVVVFGFIDREVEFTGASTRWRFPP